jgi:hypothetical protein
MKVTNRIIAAAALVALAAAAAFAQGPGGQGQGGQFNQMREKYKFTFQLMSMVRHIGEIDKNPKYTLSPAQAKKTLAVLQPLRSKPKMTQDQAKNALKGLKPIFTVTQLNAMAKIKDRPMGQRRMGGGGPGGPGGPGGGAFGRPGGGGPGGPGGRPRMMDPNAMKDFNPFYTRAAKGDQLATRRAPRWNEFFGNLQNKAKAGNNSGHQGLGGKANGLHR